MKIERGNLVEFHTEYSNGIGEVREVPVCQDSLEALFTVQIFSASVVGSGEGSFKKKDLKAMSLPLSDFAQKALLEMVAPLSLRARSLEAKVSTFVKGLAELAQNF